MAAVDEYTCNCGWRHSVRRSIHAESLQELSCPDCGGVVRKTRVASMFNRVTGRHNRPPDRLEPAPAAETPATEQARRAMFNLRDHPGFLLANLTAEGGDALFNAHNSKIDVQRVRYTPDPPAP